MSYQVLARKWRPGTFSDLVGQSHVLKPLTHALDNERLHHAYLLTGTRGVGKTTLARILARCLNCEKGVSSAPCGSCGSCTEIAEGRFVDLIEVDAASRTKVEDTRELLENVQYAPTRGRFKIYLIDEVHMLSTHSFNALLKTLEEPPPHVKFLLATTDPQKLPITILSRCLQFNLKKLTPQQIKEYLEQVLHKEGVKFEEAALWQLAMAAEGSMRDALTLLDQAISFCEGRVEEIGVKDMIGTPDQGVVYQLLACLADRDAGGMLETAQTLAEAATDFQKLLEALISALHRLAVAQVLPDAIDNSYGDRSQLLEYAQKLGAEDIQLFYQIALKGRGDLLLASNTRAMFEMVLIRMLVFSPTGVPVVPRSQSPESLPEKHTATVSSSPPAASKQKKKTLNPDPTPPEKPRAAGGTEQQVLELPRLPEELEEGTWIRLCQEINPGGITGNILAHCVIVGARENVLEMCLDKTQSAVYGEEHRDRIEQLLASYFNQSLRVSIEIGEQKDESPASYSQRLKREQLEAVRNGFNRDDNVQALLKTFSAEVLPESISPLKQ